jgi:8-oxo-dGTP diphosphatase
MKDQSVDVQHMVVGFCFNVEETVVVLIEKNRPAWQKDRLNGVGGKVEPGETPYEAMKREFREETGVELDGWDHFGDMQGAGWTVALFRLSTQMVEAVESKTDEKIKVVDICEIPDLPVLSNLRWMVPLALDYNGTRGMGGPRKFFAQY